MGTGKRQSNGRRCCSKGERKRRVHQAAASTSRRRYLEPEDFDIVDGVDTSAVELYLRGYWCSAETDLEAEESH